MFSELKYFEAKNIEMKRIQIIIEAFPNPVNCILLFLIMTTNISIHATPSCFIGYISQL